MRFIQEKNEILNINLNIRTKLSENIKGHFFFLFSVFTINNHFNFQILFKSLEQFEVFLHHEVINVNFDSSVIRMSENLKKEEHDGR